MKSLSIEQFGFVAIMISSYSSFAFAGCKRALSFSKVNTDSGSVCHKQDSPSKIPTPSSINDPKYIDPEPKQKLAENDVHIWYVKQTALDGFIGLAKRIITDGEEEICNKYEDVNPGKKSECLITRT